MNESNQSSLNDTLSTSTQLPTLNDTLSTPTQLPTLNDTLSTPTQLPELLLVFMSLQQVIFVLACSGNLFVIFVIIKYLKLQDNSNVFVLNLAVADFLTGISSGMQVFYVIYPTLNSDLIWCMLRYQIIGAMTISSQVTVFLLSVDRLVAISYASLYDQFSTTKISVLSVLLPWTFSLSVSVPPFIGWNKWNDDTKCSYSLIFTPGYFWTISCLICSMSVISCTAHIRIFQAVRMFYSRVSPSNEMSTDDKRMQRKIKSAKVMLFITILFTICWLPYITFPFAYANGYEKDFNLRQASSWLVFLGMFNSVINPVIYAWYKSDFRKACRKVCFCQ